MEVFGRSEINKYKINNYFFAYLYNESCFETRLKNAIIGLWI